MIDRTILGLLADGAFHSGKSLGEELSVCRATVWKRIGALREAGLDVYAVRGKGYRLSRSLDLLDGPKILSALDAESRALLDDLEVLQVAASTNDVLMERVRGGDRARTALLAEQQTAGRGRRGRAWVSPFATNLYLSLMGEFPGGPPALDGLSLAVGVALCEAFDALAIPGVQLKWPNDLFWDQRKLGGILIEISGEASGPSVVVVGIGINVKMDDASAGQIGQPWADISSAGYTGTRNDLAAMVIGRVMHALDDFSRHGFAPFATRWGQFDLVRGRDVDVLVGEKRISGEAVGIDGRGALLLRVGGTIRAFYGGEVSLRVRT